MATSLAIAFLSGTRRNPQGRPAACDDLGDRPPIPRGVISWSDEALPVGAGDAAVAVDGPPSFEAWSGSAPRRARVPGTEGVLFAAVLAAFLAAVSLAVADVAQGVAASVLSGDTNAALAGRVPVVETRVLSMQPVIDTASRAPIASVAKGG
jgi:hypothetical protein